MNVWYIYVFSVYESLLMCSIQSFVLRDEADGILAFCIRILLFLKSLT